MYNSSIDQSTTSSPNADKDLARSREEDDLEIEVLELETSENDIKWNVLQGTALSNQFTRLDDGHEKLELSSLTSETIDFLADQLRLLADINRSLRDEARKEVISNTIDRLIKILGVYLYKVLFKGRIQEQLENALGKRNLDLIRVELKLERNRKLASWPWDYLYRPLDEANGDGEFLAQSTQLVLNRRLNVHRSIRTRPPVKVLLVVSSPRAKMLGEVQCVPVLSEIRKLQQEQVVELCDLIENVEFSETYQPKVTRHEFKRVLAKFQPNIIHFIGHGRWTHKGGEVAFVKQGGRPDWVSDEQFADWVAQCKDLKLVFLQSCESARIAPYGMSMAMRLAHRNIPAVIAMQDKVENEIASTFACSFYEALKRGVSVDHAVKEGRDAVNDLEHPHYAFGLPVLYLSSYESLIVQEKTPNRPTLGQNECNIFRDPSSRYPCPRCDTLVAESSKVCSECGLRLYCSICNAKLVEPLKNYCNECGERLRCEQCEKRYRDNVERPLCRICRSHKGTVEAGEHVAQLSVEMSEAALRQ